jgi:hypothetical protein
LYHQVTEKVLLLVRAPYYHQPGNNELIRLYDGFFKELEPRIKPLSMSQILVEVSTQYKATEGIAFLEGKCRDFKGVTDAFALLKTVIAHMYVLADDKQYEKAKAILAEVQALLDHAIGIDPVVYSGFYRVLAVFHKNQDHAGEFYKAGLLYLAYTPLETLSTDVKRALARDLVNERFRFWVHLFLILGCL